MGNNGQIHRFLDRSRSDETISCVPCGHHIRMIAKNGQGLTGQRPCRYMKHGRKHFSSDLMHVGQHEHESLGCGERCRQSACRQASMDSSRCACLGLHLDHFESLAEDILSLLGRPSIRKLPHRRGRSDRVNGCNFTERIGHMCSCCVAFDGLKDFCHGSISLNFYRCFILKLKRQNIE